eukprot:gene975-1059_t
MTIFFLLLIALAVLSTVNSAYSPDEILSLPGWTGALPSKQYSGYLNVASGSHLHYWLVQSESDPANDPLVIWFNGGPGCSSLGGFVYEHGPFEVTTDGSTLSLRPYRWNRVVNMLYIEAPVGVGFSYNDNNDYKLNDDRTAEENLEAVEAFYALYPEFKKNDFFITGESYAGVYVPTLAEAIVKATQAGTYTGAKLTGIAVGNGCSGTQVGVCGDGTQGTYYEWQYLLQTSFVENSMKDQVNAACDWTKAANNDPDALSFHCISLLNQASKQISHVNMYDMYGDCVTNSCSDGSGVVRGKVPMRSAVVSAGSYAALLGGRITPHGPDACIDSAAASAYLNRDDVQAAIHVRNPGFCWGVCNTVKGWHYQSTRENLPTDTYPFLISNLRVVIYNGDWDACVPYTDGMGWTTGMGYPVQTAWHAWTYTSAEGNADQVAGYAIEYSVATNATAPQASFSFITVRGGRHEVPETAPAQALEMLQRFVGGKSF